LSSEIIVVLDFFRPSERAGCQDSDQDKCVPLVSLVSAGGFGILVYFYWA